MQIVRALTWDHPRGYNALAAAAEGLQRASADLRIQWDRQPLEGFESHPIADLCERYDLVVLDHPHVGEAVKGACLVPLEDIFDADVLSDLNAATIGPCLASYFYSGRHWALPLDAATQVLAMREDLIETRPPTTWDDVVVLSKETGAVALSLAGPHAILTFLSIASALGAPATECDPEKLVSADTGAEVIDLMASLAAHSPASVRDLNPIGILEHMSEHQDVALCPLIYGYVNYSGPGAGNRIAFHNAPRGVEGGCPGSTLGGTGIGISRRCTMSPELKRHLLWLMSEEVQTNFIPDHDGQPSNRAAWADGAVNARWGQFYSNTAETLEQAYVRPRHDGYIAFQSEASEILRGALGERMPARTTVEQINTLYRDSHS